ncbi:MAG TPA: 3-methyl-2-oxobutanoate hydroxymethyltransferase [Candidatus Aminicenantes bacterium]|nr:3-methyl-2-oxobutanoate hydroxymethyltransferase [Candidatus Aminicenantes bacterium]HRY65951.1 3-methyl-2-oxobutanoate hydroxymethyltransferase [Candidatus Aminicenantes bacterium]HRZ73000.1 3-methyl-2-oxobutanoate hydroxymethyltransferase [Candidatus Aminicenantes bacterium]
MANTPDERITIPLIQARKAEGRKIVCLTAYDFPTARILDEAGVDIILVGDTLGMVVLGYENTLPVTMDEMIHHARAVTRAVRRSLVVGDMPYFSFHLGADETIRNASRFLKEAGAAAVKIEGASKKRLKLVEALVEAEIPVMGHVGMTPQSIHRYGRFRVRGTAGEEARRIVEDARALERAGAFAVVIESVPGEVGAEITRALSVPTIGIGAGVGCDGQVLVLHDLIGLSTGHLPKFVRKYADVHGVIAGAVGAYAEDVRAGRFPDDATSYHLKPTAPAAGPAPTRAAAARRKGRPRTGPEAGQGRAK